MREDTYNQKIRETVGAIRNLEQDPEEAEYFVQVFCENLKKLPAHMNAVMDMEIVGTSLQTHLDDDNVRCQYNWLVRDIRLSKEIAAGAINCTNRICAHYDLRPFFDLSEYGAYDCGDFLDTNRLSDYELGVTGAIVADFCSSIYENAGKYDFVGGEIDWSDMMDSAKDISQIGSGISASLGVSLDETKIDSIMACNSQT